MTALAPTTIALAARIGPPVMPHCRRCPTRGPWAIVRGLVKPGTRYRALLGGGCHRSRFCNRSMGAEKGADMTHRQRNLVWSVLPRIKAHLRVGREMHGLHRYGIGVPRNVVGQHQDWRLAVAHEIARHGVHEIGAITTVHVGQEGVDHRHRDVGPAGAQLQLWAWRWGTRTNPDKPLLTFSPDSLTFT